ncbi:hypothetical protein [Flavobacterium alkalisoli]|uniref:hypothetical protein n=1 Tax=Flavobacterium alkalisoli TaxID=2602769 RepID=UPI003A93BE55
MKQKIYDALIKMQQEKSKTNTVTFVHETIYHGKVKKAEIKISKSAGNTTNASIVELSGYSKNYIRKMLNQSIENFTVNVLPLPKAGDEIRIRANISLKNDVTIPKDTNYYSVNNSIIKCSGLPLQKDFIADFIRVSQDGCDKLPHSSSTYKIFKLK